VPPARTTPTTTPTARTLVVTQSNSGGVTVAVGTTIVVDLGDSGGTCGLAYGAPSSSNNAVVTYVSGGRASSTTNADFRAVGVGTATLSASQSPLSPQKGAICPAIANDLIHWSLAVTVD